MSSRLEPVSHLDLLSASPRACVLHRLGKVGSFKRMDFHRKRYVCQPNVSIKIWRRTQRARAALVSASRGAPPALSASRGSKRAVQAGNYATCGTHAAGTFIQLDEIKQTKQEATRTVELELRTNQSLGFLHEGLGGKRLSSTTHLVAVQGTGPDGQPCSTLLGVGHLHRADGHQNSWVCIKSAPNGFCRKKAVKPIAGANGHHLQQRFQFGYLYTHFFYTLQDQPPYHMTGTTGEFCIGSAQDAGDCESAQFVSGMVADASGEKLLLAFGINDCEAKFGHVVLSQVDRMLHALPGESVCRPHSVRPT